jgi:CRP-like cAMP-binding protein
MPTAQDYQVPGNRLLAQLPAEDYQRLAPHLELVSLSLYEVLYEPGEIINYVYFPKRAMISLVATVVSGQTVEINLIGNEGMLGIPVFLGGKTTTNRAIVQVEGDALRIKANVLRAEFNRGGSLQSLLLLYTQAFLTQVSQLAVCNRLHTLEERLARWLLSAQDCIQSNEFVLTQEFIAQMLGTRRSGVTVAMGTLQKAGIIHHIRGRISISNRENLMAIACECYGTVKAECDRLLGH